MPDFFDRIVARARGEAATALPPVRTALELINPESPTDGAPVEDDFSVDASAAPPQPPPTDAEPPSTPTTGREDPQTLAARERVRPAVDPMPLALQHPDAALPSVPRPTPRPRGAVDSAPSAAPPRESPASPAPPSGRADDRDAASRSTSHLPRPAGPPPPHVHTSRVGTGVIASTASPRLTPSVPSAVPPPEVATPGPRQTIVRVSIGRIDVRAAPAATPPVVSTPSPPPRTVPSAPTLTLDAYLERVGGGRRR